MMDLQRTLICIPDISGFTRFMSEFDFELASKVVPSLLNKIIYSNEIGLKVSEIEGDAVLFYRTGTLPKAAELVDQCRNFHREFYRQLQALKEQYSGTEGAARIPEVLGLKIILHSGSEIGLVNIGNRIKMLGEDVIKAHRLLKNDIKFDEYILFSEDLVNGYGRRGLDAAVDWTSLEKGVLEDGQLGEIGYRYASLGL